MVGCDEIITDRTGQLTGPQTTTTTVVTRILGLTERSLLTSLTDTVCTKNFTNEPGRKGPTIYKVSFESFAMPDCALCYIKLNIGGIETTYCEENSPSIMQITEGKIDILTRFIFSSH